MLPVKATFGKWKRTARKSISLQNLQQKLKEERENKRARLDDRHYYILETVGKSIGLEKGDVEDAILEGTQIETMDKFMSADGTSQLLFFYQEPDSEKEPVEHLRLGPGGNRPVRVSKPKVFVTDGKDQALHGTCLVFTRPNPEVAISETNITKEVTFTMLDTTGPGANGHGLLHAVEHLLSSVFIPSLRKLDKGWGYLDAKEGKQTRQDFLNTLDSFVSVLVGAQESLDDKVLLKPCETYDLDTIQTQSDYVAVANSTEALTCIEDCIHVWIKQIEQVLAESEQMRREADDIGPRAELDHWKKRMSRFNFLLDQIKGSHVKAVLGVLQVAQSKLIRVWQELDRRITDVANEAKDNVKFLYTLEKFCDPLYNSDPVGMLEGIPGLINAIRMIHSISRYYNTSERMTSLFVKITNQMITACKSYITDGGIETIWTQPMDEVISHLNDCIKLNEEYQRCFHRTKQRLEEMPNERKFEFSEMYIFGKFDTFTRRMKKIIDIFETMEMYSHLSESKIEGMELMSNRFSVIVTSMRKKPYDFLDQRKMEFDSDYEEFKRQIQELHSNIIAFMDQRFDRISNTQRALWQLRRFERLNLPNLGIQDKYQRILAHYSRDIEMVSKIYQKNKSDPPVARDLPPIAGKIAWARQLYRRIQEPMEAFQQHPTILHGNEAKRIIKSFNKLAKVLLEFEMLYHRGWLRQVEAIKSGLQASLLVKHPETAELYVNFDPQILTLIRETECMARLGLEIPASARTLRSKQDHYKNNYNALNQLLIENRRVREKIPAAFDPLMAPHISKVDEAIDPGVKKLTWTSLNIQNYVTDVYQALTDLELLIDRANDLVEFRIDAVLHDMANTTLCQLPDEEAWTVEEFLEKTQILCAKGAQALQIKSVNVEDAVNELINMLCDTGAEGEEPDLDEDKYDEQDEEAEKGDEENGEKKSHRSSPGGGSRSGSRQGSMRSARPMSSTAEAIAKRKREQRENIEEAAMELLAHFNHRNLDALLKVTRYTLEGLRKRITSSSMMHYLRDEGKGGHHPFFRCNAKLAIPNIVMHPALDEVQQAVNKTAQYVMNVSKGVSQWSKERKKDIKPSVEQGSTSVADYSVMQRDNRRGSMVSMAPSESSRSDLGTRGGRKTDEGHSVATFVVHQQPKNYFKNVSENKEISKLQSLLSTSINSTKKKKVPTATLC